MHTDISILRVEDDDDLLDVVLLKQADDSECTRGHVSANVALDKILRMRSKGCDFWIAKNKTQAVGYAVGVVDGASGSYRSEGIYTCSEYRDQGIGTALKKAQIDFAKGLGCPEIWSNVARENYASMRLQQKCGFAFEPSGEGYIVRLALHE